MIIDLSKTEIINVFYGNSNSKINITKKFLKIYETKEFDVNSIDDNDNSFLYLLLKKKINMRLKKNQLLN